MRPDVAQAFDRMERAARADGVALLITSAFRSDAEQAVLWRRHPDPRWVAPPGESLHRYGTELDLGPPAAYGWLAAQRAALPLRAALLMGALALRLHAEPRARAAGGARGRRRRARARDAGFVPARFAPTLARAAQRWNVSAALLAAQLYAESNFNPFAAARRARRGSRSSCPGRRAAMGLADPFDAERRSTPRRG